MMSTENFSASEDALQCSITTVFPRMIGGSCPPHGLPRLESASASSRISGRPRHTPSFRIEDARDQIALDRGVFCEERNEGLDVVPGRGGFPIADYLLYPGDLVLRHGVLHCADRTSAAASATTAKPMRSTRATITLSHLACNARASVGTECARAWRVSSAFTGAATLR